jgi:hypothetical protein
MIHYMMNMMHTGNRTILAVQFSALLKSIILKTIVNPTKFTHSTLKRLLLSAFCLTVTIAFYSCPVAAEENLSADEIVERAVDRAEKQDRSLVEANYKSDAVTKSQSLDASGRVTGTETSRSIQYPLHGAVFEELVEKDGRPLDEKEIKKEKERKRDFIREVEKRRTRGDYIQPTKDEKIRFNREFTERYRYKIEKTEVVRGHPCWAISFKPREGKLPVRDRMDRALNQLRGTLWVDRDDFGLVRVEFALHEPFKYWGGFLAVIRKTDGWVDYTRVDSNVWLPLHFHLKLDLRVMMFKNIRRLITKDWFDYRRVNQPSDTNRIAVDGNPSPPSGEGKP